ncbi:MAG: hypothetical protein ABSB95_16505 [Dissulfurispiraceae bacterium]|jgi:hypothetical protein
MKDIILPILSIIVLLFAARQSNAAVQVYLDETRTQYIMADKLDCNIYEGKAGITIGLKAGNLLFGIGPEFTIGKTNSINWDNIVQGIVVRYKELCTRFNSGAISMKEYNERIKQIDAIVKEAVELQERMIKRIKQQSDDAFRELEKETGKDRRLKQDETSMEIEKINLDLSKLP